MSTTPAAIHDLARRLLASEPPPAESSNGQVDPVVGACEKLRVPLTKLAGAAGFSSLLSRALSLARRQAPALEAMRVAADGSLVGFNETRSDLATTEAARQAAVALVAELLSLLVTFIGEPLTLSLVHEAWPQMSVQT